jgi:hypothetical protein
VVVATGVPFVYNMYEDGNPIELSPIQEKFDEAVHVWRQGFCGRSYVFSLGTPISLQDMNSRCSTQQTASPMVYDVQFAVEQP